MKFRKNSKASVLIISLMFILIFSALSVGVAAICNTNLKIAQNQRNANHARASAESGLQIIHFWLSHIMLPSSTPTSEYFDTIIDHLQSDLADNQITNINLDDNGFIEQVTLNSNTQQNFSVQLQIDPNNPTNLKTDITGYAGDYKKNIRVAFQIDPYKFPIFNYGLATKGALWFPGNPTIRGDTYNWEGDIYIECPNDLVALYAGGNINLDGDINIYNPNASVDFDGDVLIAGDWGQTAIDNHIFTGVDPVEFPIADTQQFTQYATGDIINASTDTTKSMILTNATIKAGTNPIFESNVTINGILLIESPNIVQFDGNVQQNGIIVGDGNTDYKEYNSITFVGNFATGSCPAGSEFDAIRDETGSSILTPTFFTFFEGNFNTLDGIVAVNGAKFSGNVNAEINGTIINYSDEPLSVIGNPTMIFDRATTVEVPAGFDLWRVLSYNPSSYSEI